MTGTYTVKFYPDWVRGPRDAGSYHYPVQESGGWKSSTHARQYAIRTLRAHNTEYPDRQWRVEIYHNVGDRQKRTSYGREVGYGRIEWKRAR